MTDEDPDDFQPWTPEGAARLQAAAEQLATAVTAHAAAVTRATGEADIRNVFAANEALLPTVLAYADAQFDYTGNSFPFGVVYELVHDDDEDDDDETDLAELPTHGVTVLQRRDYAVVDESSVMAAGRAAYLRVWPGDGEAAADAHVTHLGAALYEIAHADGWDSLDEAAGLEPMGGAVTVLRQEELLTGDPDDWPDELFAGDGERLFQQNDVYHSR